MRIIALIIILLPGLLAVYGIKIMRDTVFNILHSPFPQLSIQFIFGLICFIIGLALIGGFIYRRDKKRNKVKKEFKRRRLSN